MGKGVNWGCFQVQAAALCPAGSLPPLRAVPAVDGEDAERVSAVRRMDAAVFGDTLRAPALTLQAAASAVHRGAGLWVPAEQGSVGCSVPCRGSGVVAFQGHSQNWLLNIY